MMIRRALEQCWSEKTSVCFNPKIAPISYGQCAPTAIAVFEHFGGEIMRTEVKTYDGRCIRHFYNRISGKCYDFTADQFNDREYWVKLTYMDLLSSVSEALTEMLPGQIEYMRSAFAAAWQQQAGRK
jgi:hypothetical protein